MTAHDAQPHDALRRYHRYTTWSLVITDGFIASVACFYSQSLFTLVLCLIAGALLVAMSVFWERRPPWWLATAAVVVGSAAWAVTLIQREPPFAAVISTLSVVLVISHARRRRRLWYLAGGVWAVAPALIAMAVGGLRDWAPYAITAAVAYGISVAVFRLNLYAWNLYVDLDRARADAAELAVVRERFRLASDLHDIQGHTLHVLGLKLRLADRLLDRDPTTARAHLEEAQGLVTETLTNTRSLVYGDRTVTLAGEIANAQQLLGAAGIDVAVEGEVGAASGRELHALLVRESTTNILRHAAAKRVTIAVEPGAVTVENDGSPGAPARLSGLARLAERFEQAGGTLRTDSLDGRFRTEGRLP